MNKIVVASKNPDKLREVDEVLATLSNGFELVRDLEWPDIDEPYETLEENAVHKARSVVEATGVSALADDTGLSVAALGGRPGVHSARFSGPEATYEENVVKLLSELEGVQDRRATFRTVIALVQPDGRQIVVDGVLEGRIGFERRGTGGFGYDPVFEVAEVNYQSLAEIAAEAKNKISHRARALLALSEALQR